MTSQQVLIGNVVTGPDVAGAGDDLSTEPFDLVGGHIAEALVECLPRFELFAVNQQGSRSRQPIAVLIVIAEKLEMAGYKDFPAVVVLADKPRDVVVDEL
jgi:hypothetical protein